MIYIEKGDKVSLPAKFHNRHNICVTLYDLMLSVGKERAYKSLRVTNFPLDKQDKKAFDELGRNGTDAILEYLVETGRKSVVVSAQSKNVFSAVLADFLSFIYESLACARSGKMNVAFNLVRKPVTDGLLILEQLFIDNEEFIERFHFQGDPKLYDPSAGGLGPDKIKKIIGNATKKVGAMSAFFNDSIYEFRYNKTSIAGLNWISNHAHHIVTADKNYKTPNKSLNFVFSTGEDLERYWSQYYQILPYLLAYASSIVDGFVQATIKVSEKAMAIRNLKRYLSLAFWGTEVATIIENEPNLFGLLGMDKIVCRECKQSNCLVEIDYKLFYETEYFPCAGCMSNLLKTSDLHKKLISFFKSMDR